MNKSGYFKIGYDFTDGKDKSCLVVIEKHGRGYLLINTFYDKEAEVLYKTLKGEA